MCLQRSYQRGRCLRRHRISGHIARVSGRSTTQQACRPAHPPCREPGVVLSGTGQASGEIGVRWIQAVCATSSAQWLNPCG
jgi:hypothetical protein